MPRFRTNKPKPLSDVLTKYLDDIPHRKRLKRGMAMSLWPEIVGEAISEQTKNIHFEDGTLVVHVENPVWRNEIHRQRYSITQRLNKKVGDKIIEKIVVRT